MHSRKLGIVVLLFFFVLRGDGRPRAEIHGHGVEMSAQETFWYRFWYFDRGRERMAWSEPAGTRVRDAFADAESRARAFGFIFQMPCVRQTMREAEMRMGDRVTKTLAITYYGTNITLMNMWWVDRLSDEELRSLAAHELGHVIDRQNQRYGHPLLEVMPADESSEFVADTIAMSLYGPESMQALDRHIAAEQH